MSITTDSGQKATHDGTVRGAANLLLQPAEAPSEEDRRDEQDEQEVEAQSAPQDTEEVEETEVGTDEAEGSEEDDDVDLSLLDEQDTDETDSDEEPQVFTVSVDGTEKQVTLDELRRGYSGQAYVQKGMEEVATAKKQAGQILQNLQAQSQQVAAILQLANQGQLITPPSPPDRRMADTDPVGYTSAQLQYQEDKAAYDQQQQQIHQVLNQGQQVNQQAFQANVREEMGKLARAWPDVADKEKAPQARALIAEAAKEFGYSDDEIAQVIDHRALLVLREAMMYRKLKAKSSGAREAAKQKQKASIKAGAAKRTQNPQTKARRQQKARLRKTGNIRDAAALLIDPNLR